MVRGHLARQGLEDWDAGGRGRRPPDGRAVHNQLFALAWQFSSRWRGWPLSSDGTMGERSLSSEVSMAHQGGRRHLRFGAGAPAKPIDHIHGRISLNVRVSEL